MEPTRQLVDDIYRDRVLRARESLPDDKFRAGGDLFDEALVRMRAGVLSQFPRASEAEIEDILARRLARLRQIRGLYAE